jgi:hypothetical protein
MLSDNPDRLGKLGHPEGEVALTRAAGNHDIIQMVSQAHLTSAQY